MEAKAFDAVVEAMFCQHRRFGHHARKDDVDGSANWYTASSCKAAL
jgi:hypothetical protein